MVTIENFQKKDFTVSKFQKLYYYYYFFFKVPFLLAPKCQYMLILMELNICGYKTKQNVIYSGHERVNEHIFCYTSDHMLKKHSLNGLRTN